MMMMMKLETEKLKRRELIGSGSYGAVYRGYYGEEEVAIKVFNFGDECEEEEAFRLEAYVWSQLNHADVAKFIGATQINMGEREKPHWCIVSEYLKGGTLIEYLQKNRKKGLRIPLRKVIQFALDAAKGLAYLHEEKIVHRDVKTNNMVLNDVGQGRVKLIDFGLSRKEGSNMTRNMGTEKYMAPEVRKYSRYNHKCDVFSFGICLWEMFYCRRVKIMPMCTRPRIHGDCPKKLADLMRKCWLDEERRPEMAEVVKILEGMKSNVSSMELEVANYRDQNFKGCFTFV